jgi:hypothetical protein
LTRASFPTSAFGLTGADLLISDVSAVSLSSDFLVSYSSLSRVDSKRSSMLPPPAMKTVSFSVNTTLLALANSSFSFFSSTFFAISCRVSGFFFFSGSGFF